MLLWYCTLGKLYSSGNFTLLEADLAVESNWCDCLIWQELLVGSAMIGES